MPGGRLHLLFVTDTTTFDGPERQVLHHVRRLDPKRRHARVLSMREPGELAVKLQHAEAQVLSGDVPPGAEATRMIHRFAAAYRLTQLLRAMNPDVVHAFDLESDVRMRKPCRMAGVPVIIGAYREHRAADDPWVVRARKTAHLVDAVVAPTPALAEEATRHAGVPADKVRVIPPIVDLTELRGMTRAEDLLEPKLRVGAMLRLDEAKGIDVLFAAAEKLRAKRPELEWTICGGGPEAMRWLRAAQNRGLDGAVRLAGMRNDRGAFFAGMDVFVAAGRREGLSAALLEAAAAGVPCVAARNPSVAAAFTDGVDALLVEPGDAEATAAAVDRLLDDRATASRLAAAARASIEKTYRFEGAVIALHELHERLAYRR
jgi:glycosyltransferase involved in cell wall biosynthesis